MRTPLLITILVSISITASANTSLGIKSIELNDSTIINGTEVSAITINNSDFSVDSIETSNGDLINSSEIKLIKFFKTKIGEDKLDSLGLGFKVMSLRHGGDDSGG